MGGDRSKIQDKQEEEGKVTVEKPKKKGVCGKQKGSGFEREICKKLSDWISGGERDDIFWRSAMSGGRATLQFKKGADNKSQVGDISSINKLGDKFTDHFVIECKFYKDIKIDSLVYRFPKKSSLLEFWNDLTKLCFKVNKHPIIIFKQNNKPVLLGASLFFCNTAFEGSALSELAIFPNENDDLYLYNFNESLSYLDPARLELL